MCSSDLRGASVADAARSETPPAGVQVAADAEKVDIDEVDMVGVRVLKLFCDEVEKYTNPRGGVFSPGNSRWSTTRT